MKTHPCVYLVSYLTKCLTKKGIFILNGQHYPWSGMPAWVRRSWWGEHLIHVSNLPGRGWNVNKHLTPMLPCLPQHNELYSWTANQNKIMRGGGCRRCQGNIRMKNLRDKSARLVAWARRSFGKTDFLCSLSICKVLAGNEMTNKSVTVVCFFSECQLSA